MLCITWDKYNLLLLQLVVYLGVTLDSTLFRASPSQLRVEKLCLIAEATDCHFAVLATPAGVFVHSIFMSSIIQISYPFMRFRL